MTERVELAFKAFFRKELVNHSQTIVFEKLAPIVILVNPRNTSTLCSSCGELLQKALSERTHACLHCGLVLGRDHNAALNILHGDLHTLRL